MNSREFLDFLPNGRIELLYSQNGNLGDKYKLLSYLLDRCLIGQDCCNNFNDILEKLEHREKSVSTGVGLGVAIPHCSSAYVDDPLAYMGILQDGIDFQAIDDIPVRIILLILFPQEKYDRHVKLLSVVARILNEDRIRENILKANNPGKVQQVMAWALEEKD